MNGFENTVYACFVRVHQVSASDALAKTSDITGRQTRVRRRSSRLTLFTYNRCYVTFIANTADGNVRGCCMISSQYDDDSRHRLRVRSKDRGKRSTLTNRKSKRAFWSSRRRSSVDAIRKALSLIYWQISAHPMIKLSTTQRYQAISTCGTIKQHVYGYDIYVCCQIHLRKKMQRIFIINNCVLQSACASFSRAVFIRYSTPRN